MGGEGGLRPRRLLAFGSEGGEGLAPEMTATPRREGETKGKKFGRNRGGQCTASPEEGRGRTSMDEMGELAVGTTLNLRSGEGKKWGGTFARVRKSGTRLEREGKGIEGIVLSSGGECEDGKGF